jgi:predicted PurR-regulated permease PerM
MVMAAICVAALYFAREVLIPIALAVLISFVLSPLAHMLRRIGIPRIASVFAVVFVSFGFILGVGALGTSQIA